MRRLLLIVLIATLPAGLVLVSSCASDDPAEPPLPVPPEILGQDVSGVDHQGATLGGWVDGHGRATSCWFDYGNDVTYGARTPVLDAGDQAGPVRVAHDLTGLAPTKVHWFRMVAVAGDDTASAIDTTFVTLAPPNEPPMTQTIHAPLEGNLVHFYWTGNDPDGEVMGFRWRLSDNGLDGTIDVPDTLGLPWHSTTVTDSVFAVSADQPGTPLFAQVHTFWVKAVDNLGVEDPTPAHVTFTAVTEPPTTAVALLPAAGPLPDGCLALPLPVAFTWAASDPDGPAGALLEVRTLLVGLSDLGLSECLTEAEYEALDPLAAVDEAQWSDWQEYDPGSHIQPALALGPEHVGGRYLFAAMARDVAGAWTDELTWGGNVWQVEVLPD